MVNPRRRLQHPKPRLTKEVEADLPRRQEGAGAEATALRSSPGRIEEDCPCAEDERWPGSVTLDDGRSRDIRCREKRGGSIPLEAGNSHSCLGDRTKIAPQPAREVEHLQSERRQARGPSPGDRRVGHHLQALARVQEVEKSAEALRGASAKRDLLGQRRRLCGRVVTPEVGYELMRSQRSKRRPQDRQRLPASTRHEKASAFQFHGPSVVDGSARRSILERMAAVICLEFDDTVVMDNLARLIFTRFAAPAWTDVQEEYRAGRLTIEQFHAAAFDLVDATGDEIRSFVRDRARVREGFLDLIDWAHWNGWLVAIVSTGFDLYVNTVLDDLGLDRVARHCGRTRFDYRWRVRYLSPRGIDVVDGFALSYVAAFRDAGDFVAYAGAHRSGLEAARLADAVFARGELLRLLGDQHERLTPFETFFDVVSVLDSKASGWLAAHAEQT